MRRPRLKVSNPSTRVTTPADLVPPVVGPSHMRRRHPWTIRPADMDHQVAPGGLRRCNKQPCLQFAYAELDSRPDHAPVVHRMAARDPTDSRARCNKVRCRLQGEHRRKATLRPSVVCSRAPMNGRVVARARGLLVSRSSRPGTARQEADVDQSSPGFEPSIARLVASVRRD